MLLALSTIYQQQHKLDEAIAALKQAATLLPERQRELQAQLAELSLSRAIAMRMRCATPARLSSMAMASCGWARF